MKLNLGSGGRPIYGFINIDKNVNAPDIDIACDLDRFPWPFKTDSVNEIVMNQCLEHLADHNTAMKEIHRILIKNGVAKISVPHFLSVKLLPLKFCLTIKVSAEEKASPIERLVSFGNWVTGDCRWYVYIRSA